MAQTKRLLSIALALLLGLAVFAPGVSAADPNAPIITKQPKAVVYMFAGNTLNLEIAATLPAGSNGTLSIEWYDDDWQLIATGANVKIDMPVADVNLLADTNAAVQDLTYFAVVTNTYEDSEGQTQTVSLESNHTEVTLIQPIGKLFSDYWEFAQFGNGPVYGLLIGTMAAPFLLPLTVFVFLPSYFVLLIASLVF